MEHSSMAVSSAYNGVNTASNVKKYAQVEAWGSRENANDCLSRIIQNNYDLQSMNIKLNDEKYMQLEKSIMDANPEIYGTAEKGWREEVGGYGRHNAVLYTDDKIFLPDFVLNKDSKTEQSATPPKAEAEIQPKAQEKKKETEQKDDKATSVVAATQPQTPVKKAEEKIEPEKVETQPQKQEVKPADIDKKQDEYSADDGIISPEEKLENFGKGLVSPVTKMFESPQNFCIGAGAIAATTVLIVATNGAIVPFLAAAGMTAGAMNIGQSAFNAEQALTDKEAQQAWQDMGASSAMFIPPFAGSKIALNFAGTRGTGNLNMFSSALKCFTEIPKSIKRSIHEFTSGNYKFNLRLR